MSRVGIALGKLFLPAALAVLAACAGVAPPKRLPPSAPARTITPEQRTAIDRQYFLAVSAYAREDYPAALALVKQILVKDPRNRDALSLRSRIVAAQKAGGP